MRREEQHALRARARYVAGLFRQGEPDDSNSTPTARKKHHYVHTRWQSQYRVDLTNKSSECAFAAAI